MAWSNPFRKRTENTRKYVPKKKTMPRTHTDNKQLLGLRI
jgi:hypothetical protein